MPSRPGTSSVKFPPSLQHFSKEPSKKELANFFKTLYGLNTSLYSPALEQFLMVPILRGNNPNILPLLTSIPKWQHIILPFLLNFFQSGSKADKDPKTEAATNDRHLFSLILNIFAVAHKSIFDHTNGARDDYNIGDAVFGSITYLQGMLGWRRDVVGIARMMLSSLVSLISSTHKRQFSNLSFVGWDKIHDLIAVIEHFVFYQPAQTAAARESKKKKSKQALGLHTGRSSRSSKLNCCHDQGLVELVVLLCQQLLELLKPISMEVANGLYQNSQCTLSRKQQMKKVEEFNRGISLHLVFFKALLGGFRAISKGVKTGWVEELAEQTSKRRNLASHKSKKVLKALFRDAFKVIHAGLLSSNEKKLGKHLIDNSGRLAKAQAQYRRGSTSIKTQPPQQELPSSGRRLSNVHNSMLDSLPVNTKDKGASKKAHHSLGMEVGAMQMSVFFDSDDEDLDSSLGRRGSLSSSTSTSHNGAIPRIQEDPDHQAIYGEDADAPPPPPAGGGEDASSGSSDDDDEKEEKIEEEEEDRTEQEEEVFWLLPGQIVKIMCVCEKILEKSGSIPRYFECDSCQTLLELPDSEKQRARKPRGLKVLEEEMSSVMPAAGDQTDEVFAELYSMREQLMLGHQDNNSGQGKKLGAMASFSEEDEQGEEGREAGTTSVNKKQADLPKAAPEAPAAKKEPNDEEGAKEEIPSTSLPTSPIPVKQAPKRAAPKRASLSAPKKMAPKRLSASTTLATPKASPLPGPPKKQAPKRASAQEQASKDAEAKQETQELLENLVEEWTSKMKAAAAQEEYEKADSCKNKIVELTASLASLNA